MWDNVHVRSPAWIGADCIIGRGTFIDADVVLGAPNFNTFVQVDLTKAGFNAQNNTLLTPVSATSDGTRVFVSDLGHNRVLIWNSIPTRTSRRRQAGE